MSSHKDRQIIKKIKINSKKYLDERGLYSKESKITIGRGNSFDVNLNKLDILSKLHSKSLQKEDSIIDLGTTFYLSKQYNHIYSKVIKHKIKEDTEQDKVKTINKLDMDFIKNRMLKANKIFLKPNWVCQEKYPVTTDPAILNKLINILETEKKEYLIGEAGSLFFDQKELFQSITKKIKSSKIIHLDNGKYIQINYDNLKIFVPEIMLEFDLIINIAQFKEHNFTSYSSSRKNLLSLLPPFQRLALHKDIDLMSRTIDALQHILPRRLSIIDGRKALIKAQQIAYGGKPIAGFGTVISTSDICAEQFALKKMKKKIIYFVRHGESASQSQKKGIFQGKLNPDLSSKGKIQAKRLGAYFSKKDILLISSPLKRAIHTAEEIKKYNIFNPNISVNVNIKEIDFGIFEGHTKEEIIKKYPNLWLKRKNSRLTFKDHKGESYLDVKKRFRKFISEIDKIGKVQIVVVSHATIIIIGLSMLLNRPIEDVEKTFFENGGITAINKIGNSYSEIFINRRPDS